MDAREFARRMERQRLFWVTLEPGVGDKPAKRVQLLRPLIDEAVGFSTGVGIEHVCTFLRDWDGITESDLLSGSDSNEPVEYDQRIASLAMRDNADWSIKIARAMGSALEQRARETEAVEKKLETS